MPIRKRDFMPFAAFAAKLKAYFRTIHLYVTVAQGCQAKGFVGSRILLVTDAYKSGFQQANDGREDLFARHSRQSDIRFDTLANQWQRFAKGHQALIFGFITDFAPALVIAILFP